MATGRILFSTRLLSLCEPLHNDNNIAEKLIRDLAIGRKNFMFAGSHNGAKNAAIIYSFIGTCKLHRIILLIG
jgi:hypothetical protein